MFSSFIGPDGKIKALPAQEKKFQLILGHVLKAFEPEVRYSEKQVNEILGRFHEETASLRRGLIEYKMMSRQAGDAEYWRID